MQEELSQLKIILRCPACRGGLSWTASSCQCAACRRVYPLVGDVPILINEGRSLFSIQDFIKGEDGFFKKESKLRRVFFAVLPSLSMNTTAKHNYDEFASRLKETNERPRVLVLGGGVLGAGMKLFRSRNDIDFINTDVSSSPMVKVVCDSHDIPLPDASVHGVVAQAVLEHVADPFRCVDEIGRVLKQGGVVYAETPFMEPAHATPFDFHRFTYIGYRRLFRSFELIGLGPIGGPAQALAHQWEHSLLCLSKARAIRPLLFALARLSGFWLKYADLLLNRSPHSLHCAFALYFMGRKSNVSLTDRQVLEECRRL